MRSQAIRHSDGSKLHRAAVITPGLVFYGNGTGTEIPADLNHDIDAILRGTAGRFVQHSSIVIDGASAPGLRKVTAGLTEGNPRAGEWSATTIDAWTLFRHPDGRTVAVGLRDEMKAPHFGVLFDRDTDPGVLAVRLDRYQRATGNAWRGTCATSALNAIRLTWGNDRYQPRWRHDKIPARSAVGPLVWRRELNENERWWGYVHTFDGNNAYLGSAITADLAWSELHHVGPQLFDPGLPGYWLVELDTATLAALANPARPPLLGRVRDGRAWMTTPYARLLWDLGDRCNVVDSWTGRAEVRQGTGTRLHPAGSRILRTWGEMIRDGLADAPPSIVPAVKRTYKDAVGGMQRESMRIFRTDWAETVIDLWRATLYRRMLQVRETQGYWPVRVATDSVSYADSSPDPSTLAAALGVRPGLGGFKHESTVTTSEWLQRHEKQVRTR